MGVTTMSTSNVVDLSAARKQREDEYAKPEQDGMDPHQCRLIIRRLYEALSATLSAAELSAGFKIEIAATTPYTLNFIQPYRRGEEFMLSLQLTTYELEFVLSARAKRHYPWVVGFQKSLTPLPLCLWLRETAKLAAFWESSMGKNGFNNSLNRLGKTAGNTLLRLAAAEPGGFLDRDCKKNSFLREWMDFEEGVLAL